MTKLEIISVRPVDGIIRQFYKVDEGILEYIKQKFEDTNKLVSISSKVSEDYSTQTKTFLFNTQEDYVDFVEDKVLQYQNVLQDRYNTYHKITIVTNDT